MNRTQMNRTQLTLILLGWSALIMIEFFAFGYYFGYEDGRSNPFPLKESGCHEIDEICHEEIHDYAKSCVEEQETTVEKTYYNTTFRNCINEIAVVNITGGFYIKEEVNETCETWSRILDWDVRTDLVWRSYETVSVEKIYKNETVKELWDICDGVKIR